MILKEMMLESLQGMALPVQGGTPVPAQEKAGGGKSVFSDVLSSTVKANENGGNGVKRNGNDTAGNGKEIKTFRELRNKISREAEKPTANAKAEAADDLEDGTKKATAGRKVNHGTAESLMNCIAQLLGLNPADFLKLLQAANITPEELANATDVRQLTDRLAAVLGLNGEQSGVLKDLLEMIKAQIQAQALATDSGTNGETVAANAADGRKDAAGVAEETGGPRIEIVRMPEDPQSGLAELIARMKLKLGELKDKLENGKEGLAEEISQRLEAILKDMGGAKVKNMEIQPMDGQETADTVKTGNPAAAAIDLNEARKEAGNNSGNNPADSKEGKGKAQKADTTGVKSSAEAAAPVAGDNGNPLAAAAAGTVQKAGESIPVDRPTERIPVQAKEIINQVVEKAKVVLTGDKSEMVMDLKPDSLGKLSLKVVTENGIVTARFVAENQQVKQVLESNMQLLKDALEKQGMNVQGFSVSVRQDSPRSFSGQDGPGSSGRLSHRRSAFRTEGLTAAMDKITAMERHNPYRLSTSTVEFTA